MSQEKKSAANTIELIDLVRALNLTRTEKYRMFDHIDFGAKVAGDLAQYAMQFEDTLSEIIANYFCRPSRKEQFTWLLLRREGLTFHDKIELVQSMVPEFTNASAAAAAQELKPLLKRVIAFKAKRNAFAHGYDVTPKSMEDDPCIHMQIARRNGEEKIVEVTVESHRETMCDAWDLLNSLQSVAKRLRAENSRSANGKEKTNGHAQ